MTAPSSSATVCFANTLGLLCLTAGAKTLFHGTSQANCAKIQRDGFIPSLEDGRFHTHHGEGVYFTPSRGHALSFARTAERMASELWCSASGYFCASAGVCLIELDIDLAESPHALVASAYFNFDAPLDFTKSPSNREYVFKHQGLQKHQGATLTFHNLSGRELPANGQLKLNSHVFFELGNRVRTRTLSELLATRVQRDELHCVTCYMASSVLLTQPSLQGFNSLLERASVALGCSPLDCGGVFASAMTALDEAGGVLGGVAGAAFGAVMFHHVASEIVGSRCTRCAQIAAVVGGFVGFLVAMPVGAELGASLAQWFSKHVAGRILDFFHSLAGVNGRHAAFKELDLLWSPAPSCAVIRQRRRSMMLRYHPDLCSSEECQEKSVRINTAFVKLARTCVEETHDHSSNLAGDELDTE